MCGLRIPQDENVLLGLTSPDDAGIYKISEDLALIQTVDFFTPIVDDPYDFGRIAVTNALSDVYAMGGVPKTALNLVAFPSPEMDLSILRSILEGGISKMEEAGVSLVGGHTIKDDELKYGIAVTGFVNPKRFYSKHGLKPGDVLILTKPIGTGVLSTALKKNMVGEDSVKAMTESMLKLNKNAMEASIGLDVHACTDITGFGLLGHIAEMIEGLDVGIIIQFSNVPLLPGALEAAGAGLVPGGTKSNMEFRKNMVIKEDHIKNEEMIILFDAQTSGGLLFGMPESEAEKYIKNAENLGENAWVIGMATSDHPGKMRII